MKTLKNALIVSAAALALLGCSEEVVHIIPEDGSIPEQVADTLEIKKVAKTYVITGIGTRGTNRVAIINDQVLTPGKEIDPGVYLIAIRPTYAVIGHGTSKYMMRPENIQLELDNEKKQAGPAAE